MITLNTPYRTESVEGVAREKRERYDYPEGLNLQPDHDQHGKIVQWVMRRARKSYSVIQEKFPIWDKLDESCTAYIRTDEAERLRQQKDPRKPTSIVMPITYSVGPRESGGIQYLVCEWQITVKQENAVT